MLEIFQEHKHTAYLFIRLKFLSKSQLKIPHRNRYIDSTTRNAKSDHVPTSTKSDNASVSIIDPIFSVQTRHSRQARIQMVYFPS